jgi:fatty acid/phospholipid biosynthesis enzyme
MPTNPGAGKRIAIDAMGGDLGPTEVVAAVQLALKEFPSLNPITLVGDEGILTPLMKEFGLKRNERLSVHHASEVITMDDKPLNALKKKKDSSMVRAIELVKSGEAGVVLSCGNTGALMGKGSALITETNESLRRVGDLINYAGPIEGFHVFAEHVDVVVCDGFVGNIMLKSWESLVKFFSSMLKEELQANPLRLAGAILSKGAFHAFKERINPERYGGAPLLGLNGNVLKAHGSSNRRAIRSAIRAANEMVKADMNQHIEGDIAKANALLAQPVYT